MALAAAGLAARQHGVTPYFGDAIEGESREVAVVMAGMAKSAKQYGHPISGPAVLLSGGETTVTVNNTPHGKGAAIPSFYSVWPVRSGEHGIWAMAGDSDGIDGTEDAAGAIVFRIRLRAAS